MVRPKDVTIKGGVCSKKCDCKGEVLLYCYNTDSQPSQDYPIFVSDN